MLNLQKLMIDPFAEELRSAYIHAYGSHESGFGEIIAWVTRLALEILADCDALYHNLEHTIMVTSAGKDILIGKHLIEGGVSPKDWLNFMMALLCHDIGYVRGLCRNDREGYYATGVGDEMVEIPVGGTDASLTPYHVDRGKLFLQERFGGRILFSADIEVIAGYIEMTRFPPPQGASYQKTKNFAGLIRAADFIGQLGDPNYLRKIPALFYEFEETGVNKKLGYTNPGRMRQTFAKFYWDVVTPYIQDALYYLSLTQDGKQWISNLHSHVFTVEHTEDLGKTIPRPEKLKLM